MPIDYTNYHPEWLTRIRPDILKRAENCCEFCKVQNEYFIYRGVFGGKHAYQNVFSEIYCAKTGEYLGST